MTWWIVGCVVVSLPLSLFVGRFLAVCERRERVRLGLGQLSSPASVRG